MTKTHQSNLQISIIKTQPRPLLSCRRNGAEKKAYHAIKKPGRADIGLLQFLSGAPRDEQAEFPSLCEATPDGILENDRSVLRQLADIALSDCRSMNLAAMVIWPANFRLTGLCRNELGRIGDRKTLGTVTALEIKRLVFGGADMHYLPGV